MSAEVTYGKYLRIEQLLDLQHCDILLYVIDY